MRCRNSLVFVPVLGCVRLAARSGRTTGVVTPGTARIVAATCVRTWVRTGVGTSTITERCGSDGRSSANRPGRQSGIRRYSRAHDTSIVAVCGAPVLSTRDTGGTRGGRRMADARLGALDRQPDAALPRPAEGEQCRARERRGRNRNFSNTRLFHIHSPLWAVPCCRQRPRIWAISGAVLRRSRPTLSAP
jgi:hypothetical protein